MTHPLPLYLCGFLYLLSMVSSYTIMNVNIVLQYDEICMKLVGCVWFLLSLQRCMIESREAIMVKSLIIV